MGFFNDLKNFSNRNKKRKEEKQQKINQNPTEEELKNNKKGKLAYLWTIISIAFYILGFGMVFAAWEENIAVGIFALILALTITPLPHRKAISLAQEQRRINGRGRLAYLLALLLPLAILVAGVFFFVFGGIYYFI